jgi:hypothetical protein
VCIRSCALGAATTLLLAAACGTDDRADALDYARRACQLFDHEGTAVVSENWQRMRDAASLAASAARRDAAWDGLSDAMNQLLTDFEELRNLPSPTFGAPADDRGRVLIDRADASVRTIHQECAKADAE